MPDKLKSMSDAVRAAYRAGEEDETLNPIVRVAEDGTPVGRMQDGDYIIFYGERFRGDYLAGVYQNDNFFRRLLSMSSTETARSRVKGPMARRFIFTIWAPQPSFSPISSANLRI